MLVDGIDLSAGSHIALAEPLMLLGNPVAPLEASPKQYVDIVSGDLAALTQELQETQEGLSSTKLALSSFQQSIESSVQQNTQSIISTASELAISEQLVVELRLDLATTKQNLLVTTQNLATTKQEAVASNEALSTTTQKLLQTSQALETASNDISALRLYVDAVSQGLDPKASVRVATTSNISLTGLLTVDGVVLVDGNRVLVKNQTLGAQNGIYVARSTAWSRAVDADSSSKVTTGLYTFVETGTTGAATGWNLVTNNVVLGTTALAFTQFGAAVAYTVGSNLTLTGNVISLPNSNIPYDISGAVMGKPSASSVVSRLVAVRAFTLPISMAGSFARTSVAATSSTILSVRKNNAQFATITFASGAASGTFVSAAVSTFAAGDLLTVLASGTVDATFADASFTFVAALV